MSNDPSRLGIVESVSGAEITVALHSSTVSGLMFVHGNPYYVAQVGKLHSDSHRPHRPNRYRIASRCYTGSTNDTGATGRMWMTCSYSARDPTKPGSFVESPRCQASGTLCIS